MLLRSAIVIGAAVVVSFVLLQWLPGDPLDRLDSPRIPPDQAARTRQALGLDEDPLTQFFRTLDSYARGELGVSTSLHRPVATLLGDSLPWTLLLGGSALLLGYALGGVAALAGISLTGRQRRTWDRLLLLFATVPRFWFAVVLLWVLHGWLGWLPSSHASSPGVTGIADRLRHLVLPLLALSLPAAAVVARYQLAALETTERSAFVRAARAGGVGRGRLIALYLLRPSLSPLVGLLGLDLPALVAGAVVIETVFAWPGVGRLTAGAILESDYPLALASVLLTVAFVLLGRGLAWVLSRSLDPRQRGETMPW